MLGNLLCFFVVCFFFSKKIPSIGLDLDFACKQYAGLTLPLVIVAICYKKCRLATNISQWLKVPSSRWLKNHIFKKKLISFRIYQYSFNIWTYSLPAISSNSAGAHATLCRGY